MLLAQDILLILHFFSLTAGFVSLFGAIAMALATRGAGPSQMEGLARMPPAFLKVGSWGLAGLWLTGILLLWTRWNWRPPELFAYKIGCVIGLTAAIGYMHMIAARMRRTGDASLAERVAIAGPFAGIFSLLALVFAVLTFH
jgi:hypothetical protein